MQGDKPCLFVFGGVCVSVWEVTFQSVKREIQKKKEEKKAQTLEQLR